MPRPVALPVRPARDAPPPALPLAWGRSGPPRPLPCPPWAPQPAAFSLQRPAPCPKPGPAEHAPPRQALPLAWGRSTAPRPSLAVRSGAPPGIVRAHAAPPRRPGKLAPMPAPPGARAAARDAPPRAAPRGPGKLAPMPPRPGPWPPCLAVVSGPRARRGGPQAWAAARDAPPLALPSARAWGPCLPRSPGVQIAPSLAPRPGKRLAPPPWGPSPLPVRPGRSALWAARSVGSARS